MGDERCEVGRHPGIRDGGPELGERIPSDGAVVGIGGELFPSRSARTIAQREAPDTAVPDDLRRHALADGALLRRVPEDREVGVTVGVDETGADNPPRRGNQPSRPYVAETPDVDDPVSCDCDVRDAPGIARAINDAAVADQDIDKVHPTRPLWPCARLPPPATDGAEA